MIEIKGFSKSYGKFVAVNNINLSIEKGEIVGFVGKNGAGKSTTIRAMMNMIFPSQGTITIDGLDSIKDTKAIKGITSYMPSETEFNDNLKAREVFKFCCKFSTKGMDEAERLAELFELNMDKKIKELSLGNRKKVSIIQALLKNAKVIILDEPTSGLDPLMQEKFFKVILEAKSAGMTVFLSSHNLSEVEKYCDKVAIIKDGQIVDFLDLTNISFKHKQSVTVETKDGETQNFDFDGDINYLIRQLATIEIARLEIKDKSVTDEFIDYYKTEAETESQTKGITQEVADHE
ncbi:MAG: ABC transporter ATP-binding protein [Anaerovoracaceae bacterium]